MISMLQGQDALWPTALWPKVGQKRFVANFFLEKKFIGQKRFVANFIFSRLLTFLFQALSSQKILPSVCFSVFFTFGSAIDNFHAHFQSQQGRLSQKPSQFWGVTRLLQDLMFVCYFSSKTVSVEILHLLDCTRYNSLKGCKYKILIIQSKLVLMHIFKCHFLRNLCTKTRFQPTFLIEIKL